MNILNIIKDFRLPTCDTSCQFEGTNTKIANGAVCITDTNVIYSYKDNKCSIIESGIRVFQKMADLNTYNDVTDSLDSITLSSSEIDPLFILYECSSTSCVQTSGYIKYKLSSAGSKYEFMKCIVPSSTDGDDDDFSSLVGCSKLIGDSSASTCDATRVTHSSYYYDETTDPDSPIFYLCMNVKVDNTNTYRYIPFIFSEEEQIKWFSFQNGESTFPNTVVDGDVVVKIMSHSITVASSKNIYFYLLYMNN
ncbi:MAG: hypothetical protein E7Z84_05730 [Methanosphaera stadtmanae]|nr:hypothetical protein [Methanosphaera stadtmanae]